MIKIRNQNYLLRNLINLKPYPGHCDIMTCPVCLKNKRIHMRFTVIQDSSYTIVVETKFIPLPIVISGKRKKKRITKVSEKENSWYRLNFEILSMKTNQAMKPDMRIIPKKIGKPEYYNIEITRAQSHTITVNAIVGGNLVEISTLSCIPTRSINITDNVVYSALEKKESLRVFKNNFNFVYIICWIILFHLIFF